MLRVAVEVGSPGGVLVRRTILVEVLVVLGAVRMIGVATEDVEEANPSVASTGVSTGASVGGGTTSDSSVRGVVIAGSVPK